MSKNLSKLSGRKGLKDNLFEQVKCATGPDNIATLADHYLVGKSTISGSRTFYDFLDLQQLSDKQPDQHQPDIKARVCLGTSCMCSGDPAGIKTNLEATLGPGAVGSAVCLGHCYHADSFQYLGRNYSGGQLMDELTLRNLAAQDKDEKQSSVEDFNVRCISNTCILTDQDFSSLEHFESALQDLLKHSRIDILASIKAS